MLCYAMHAGTVQTEQSYMLLICDVWLITFIYCTSTARMHVPMPALLNWASQDISTSCNASSLIDRHRATPSMLCIQFPIDSNT